MCSKRTTIGDFLAKPHARVENPSHHLIQRKGACCDKKKVAVVSKYSVQQATPCSDVCLK